MVSQAVEGVRIHQLSIKDTFDGLSPKEKLYSHHMVRAAWSGTRIILRQVSPEANSIYNFITELAGSCREHFSGNWTNLAVTSNVQHGDMKSFLEYAAKFLSNLGNFHVILSQPIQERIPLRFRDLAIKNLFQICPKSP